MKLNNKENIMVNDMMRNSNRSLSLQNFKNEKEMSAFPDNLTGKPFELQIMDLTAEEQVQYLVSEAYSPSSAKAKENIKRHLNQTPTALMLTNTRLCGQENFKKH